MERARSLVESYAAMDGFLGAYLVGSATRPHRDALSDLDIEIVVEDAAYQELPAAKRHVLVLDEGPPRRVDHEFYFWPWTEFEGLRESRLDLFHFPYQHAVVLSDPEHRISPVIEALGALPDEVREERMRVHLLEFVFGVGRVRRTSERGAKLNVRLVAADAIEALVKLLFLVQGSWPSTRHWTEQELWLLGVPEGLLSQVAAAAETPSPEALSGLADEVKAWLEREGHTIHQDLDALMAWAFLSPAGKAAFERWGGG